MNRGQLAFLVLVNAMVSLVIALGVVWAFEAQRPDPEELAAINTPRPQAVLAAPQSESNASSNPDPTSVLDGAATPQEQSSQGSPPAEEETAETPSPTNAAEEVYVVQPGDTLLGIATQYDVTVQAILDANGLNDPNTVFSGQRLVIPVQGSAPAAAQESESGDSGQESQGVQISSVSNPTDLPNEQILIVNESNSAVSLQGWQLQRVDGPAYTFEIDVPLFPGGSVRLHSAAGENTTIDLYWGLNEPIWQSGVTAQLANADGEVVSSYTVP